MAIQYHIDKLVFLYLFPPTATAPPEPLPLVFGNVSIEPVKFARNLGVYFDEHLSMERQTIEASRKAFSSSAASSTFASTWTMPHAMH